MLPNDYKILNVDTIESPALAIYPDMVVNNIRNAIEIAGKNVLRPHVKTCKTPEVIKLMMDQGISKFKCATIAEAEMLGIVKAKDVLLAIQPLPLNIERLKNIVTAYPDTVYSCIFDNPYILKVLEEKFTDKVLDIYIDLNIGMNRSGIKSENSYALIDESLKVRNLKLSGIHAYNGKNNDPDKKIRENKSNEGYKLADEVRRYAEKKAGRKMELIFGGSPDFMYNARQNDVQCSPGTFVFWDTRSARFSDLPFKIAVVIITRVISIIDRNLLCLDLGYKAVGSENPLNQRVQFLNIENAEPESQSEEHLVVKVPDTREHNLGDVWYAMPYHICSTVALYGDLQVIENGFRTNQWKVTARNRKIIF